MIAALLLAAPTDPATLDKYIRAYDRALVKDALTGDEKVRRDRVAYPTRQRGRPSGS